VRYVIRHYTREAGVRNLERTIGTICRKQARRLAEGKTDKLVVTKEVIQEFLGGIKIRAKARLPSAPSGPEWRWVWPGLLRAATCSSSKPMR
jgi:ATP-dependent Lon protease